MELSQCGRCIPLKVKGLGIDAVDVGRMRETLARRGRRFLKRILSDREMEDLGLDAGGRAGGADIAARIAARFAAKEAVAKALGCGISRVAWKDIAVLRSGGGPIRVELAGGAMEVARSLGVSEVQVSITHERTIAVAVALAQGE
ncbi:MAG: holo-ACP synthase [Firmicutes bacterium]|nr:holo-ACP synthase [Bacillota bacterium]